MVCRGVLGYMHNLAFLYHLGISNDPLKQKSKFSKHNVSRLVITDKPAQKLKDLTIHGRNQG